MTAENEEKIWLTQEAFDNLTEELEFLRTEGRAAISAKIALARDEGDLSENAGYHAAREEQGQQEARIRQLTAILDKAEVGEAPTAGGTIAPGMQVTIEFHGRPGTETFLLGSREMMATDPTVTLPVFSPNSPIGAAILGKRRGDRVSYRAPNGRNIKITIKAVQPYQE